MKKFAILFALVLLCSCSKKDYEANVSKFNSEVAGEYHSFVFIASDVGEGLDLDGEAPHYDNDVLLELRNYTSIQDLYSCSGYVDRIDGSNFGRIYLKFPMQDITVREDGGYDVEVPVFVGITFTYQVNSNGEVSVSPHVDYSELDRLKGENKYVNVKDAHITQLSMGRISVDMTMGFYNYNRGGGIIETPVTLVYYNNYFTESVISQ